ncbi:hypothetical protein FB567DRAFT_628841 [Paraphoma chrysanthemicola]|uniref:Uncharacterized protein n=1 Tax=Paraphoma chrysanthemicola TaxID=798071 RepID=A0A8K0R4D6_9PLEO|nr:hypothetical protein FB567DRAFT_628841 [Paraphoma chrysanthemicola]
MAPKHKYYHNTNNPKHKSNGNPNNPKHKYKQHQKAARPKSSSVRGHEVNSPVSRATDITADQTNRAERNDRESPLLRLPREIRNIIYEYALSGVESTCSSQYPTATYGRRRRLFGPGFRDPPQPCGLVQVCSKIYHEAKLLPLGLGTLRCPSVGALKALYKKLPEAQSQRVKDMVLVVTMQCENNLEGASFASMFPGVRRVTMEMDGAQRSALRNLSDAEIRGQLWLVMALMEQWITGGKMGKKGSVEVVWGKDWPAHAKGHAMMSLARF